ncbi:MAG: NAD(P)-dependent oxidoreductase [Lachnospiraceae bacterium]|nr:NAD(P)-dependent oxidoreductase [Lachnospiraceae bacterium]
MKVLIIGSYGLVVGNLIARMHREKCDVYVLTGKRKVDKRKGMPRHIAFFFQEDSADLKYVIQGIMPDYLIFAGAWDENYEWEKEECASAFSSALVNILSWAKEYKIPKVCYLSCMDAATEQEARGKIVRDGERICETYAEPGFEITALRVPYVYGASLCAEDTLDLLSEQCFLARGGEDYRLPSITSELIYVTDLADAVFRVGKESLDQNPFSCYEVGGKERIDGSAFTSYIEKLYEKSAAKASGEIQLTDIHTSESSAFNEDFGYTPRIDVTTGLERIENFLSKNHKKIAQIRRNKRQEELQEKSQSVKAQIKQGMTIVIHIFENLLVFAVAFAAQYFLNGENSAFLHVDFLLLYIVLMALKRGVGESILAVLLAASANLWMALLEGGTVSSIMSQYQFVLQVLFYFVIAIGISYSFLLHRTRLKERMDQLRELEEEYTRIIDINRTNVEIKKAFEDRLINYGDSIGKIYNVVSELDVLEVDKVIMASLRVVSKIMSVKDVSIYYAGTDQYFHFVGATTKETGGLRTILLSEYKELEEALLEGDVFINHEIGGELPRMAAPIYSGNKLIYIIMLWHMEFEEINLYKKNLFLVLVKIITSSLEKGYQYEKVGRNQEYYEDTNIMLPDAFRNRIEEQLKGVPQEEAEYTLVCVAAEGRDRTQLNMELSGLLRDSDRIGYLKEGSDYIYILAHTNFDGAEFVVRKLTREGFRCKVVTKDEH